MMTKVTAVAPLPKGVLGLAWEKVEGALAYRASTFTYEPHTVAQATQRVEKCEVELDPSLHREGIQYMATIVAVTETETSELSREMFYVRGDEIVMGELPQSSDQPEHSEGPQGETETEKELGVAGLTLYGGLFAEWGPNPDATVYRASIYNHLSGEKMKLSQTDPVALKYNLTDLLDTTSAGITYRVEVEAGKTVGGEVKFFKPTVMLIHRIPGENEFDEGEAPVELPKQEKQERKLLLPPPGSQQEPPNPPNPSPQPAADQPKADQPKPEPAKEKPEPQREEERGVPAWRLDKLFNVIETQGAETNRSLNSLASGMQNVNSLVTKSFGEESPLIRMLGQQEETFRKNTASNDRMHDVIERLATSQEEDAELKADVKEMRKSPIFTWTGKRILLSLGGLMLAGLLIIAAMLAFNDKYGSRLTNGGNPPTDAGIAKLSNEFKKVGDHVDRIEGQIGNLNGDVQLLAQQVASYTNRPACNKAPVANTKKPAGKKPAAPVAQHVACTNCDDLTNWSGRPILVQNSTNVQIITGNVKGSVDQNGNISYNPEHERVEPIVLNYGERKEIEVAQGVMYDVTVPPQAMFDFNPQCLANVNVQCRSGTQWCDAREEIARRQEIFRLPREMRPPMPPVERWRFSLRPGKGPFRVQFGAGQHGAGRRA